MATVATVGQTLLGAAVVSGAGQIVADYGRAALAQSRIINDILLIEGGTKRKIAEAIGLQTSGWIAIRWGALVARGGVIVGGAVGGYAIGAYAMCTANPDYYSQ